jgi:hypothetical protein
MERLFKDMGIRKWTVDIPCVTGRLKENTEFQISPEEGRKYLRYGYGGGIHTAASGFAYGLHVSLDELKCDCEYIESCREVVDTGLNFSATPSEKTLTDVPFMVS